MVAERLVDQVQIEVVEAAAPERPVELALGGVLAGVLDPDSSPGPGIGIRTPLGGVTGTFAEMVLLTEERGAEARSFLGSSTHYYSRDLGCATQSTFATTGASAEPDRGTFCGGPCRD